MYTPKAFAVNEPAQLYGLMRAYPFALLVTQDAGNMVASHLPFLVDPGSDAGNKGLLLSHMAKANPQWRDLNGRDVLVIFQGPHAYVSATWYEDRNTVPTWNYAAVHVYGRAELIQDPQAVRELLKRTVETFEAGSEAPWSMDVPEAKYLEGMMDGIMAFRIHISRLEGKWKLNQNHSRERQERVIRQLAEQSHPDARQIAEWMKENV